MSITSAPINRISHAKYDPNLAVTGDEQLSYYSYDVHGNVNELVQDNPELGHLGGQAYSQRYKRMTYSYELVSGNVKEVRYQQGEGDMYVHRYAYDADNRVLAAWTSRDGVLWSRDAKYLYYLHGPLGRTELGDKQVQGTDYVFTIQGWIKGVNSNVLDRDKDIGKDGHNSNATNYIASQQGIHSNTAIDAFGFTLDYFWNNATGKRDYKPINTAAQSLYNDAPNATSGVNDLYNGNIKGMAVALQKPNGAALPQNLGLQYNQYKYDQLNRITLHQAYTGTSTTGYASLTNTNEYRNVFSYDANGNIITQLRNGTAASGLSMDNLQYNYYTSTGSTYNPATATPTNATNKLAYVDDSGTPANYADDLEDQSAGNYTYDATGQLTGDVAEQIANIEWTVYGKIANITRTAGSTKKELTFKYDALGQRVMKLAKDRDVPGVMTQENWTYTYYVRDAQGNVMATYKRSLTANITTQQATDKLVLEESHIYGSSRLGVDDRETENINSTNTFAWSGGYTAEGELIPAAVPTQAKMTAVNVLTPKRKLGLKLYELSNHLGNVLVTVSDRKLTKQLGATASVEFYMADVRSTSDYSAFGAPLSGRTFSSSSYKYGFNGMEKDAEMHGNDGDSYDFGARMYDARVGRFFSRDNYESNFSYQSPYVFAECTPISAIDVNGDYVRVKIIKYYNDENGSLKVKKWYNIFKETVRVDKVIYVHNAKLYNASGRRYSQAQLERAAQVIERNIKMAWETAPDRPANGGFVNEDNDDVRTIELNVKVVFVGGIKVIDDKRKFKWRDHRFIIDKDENVNKTTNSTDAIAYVPPFNRKKMYFKVSTAEKQLGLTLSDDVPVEEIPYTSTAGHEFGHQGKLPHTDGGIMKAQRQPGEKEEFSNSEEKRKIFKKY
jgi:RHS repeat-associated protein